MLSLTHKLTHRFCCLLLPLLLCVVVATAQSGRKVPGKPAPHHDTIRINTAEVQLAVTVRDSLGQAVAGLQAADFAIYDNGKRYEPTHCEFRHLPLNLVLLLDGAGGFFEDKEAIRQLLLTFRRELAPTDQLAVLQFTDELTLTQDWGNDEAAWRKALQPALRPNGKAALTDALALAAAKLAEIKGRRVILLLTSGLNTASLSDFTQAWLAVQSVAATVYVFSETEAIAAALRQANRKPAGAEASLLWLANAEAELITLAEASGGKIFFPLQERSLGWMLAETANDLRGQYLLSYAPEEGRGEPDGLHLIHVIVRGGHQTYARAGAQWPARQKPSLGTPFVSVSGPVRR